MGSGFEKLKIRVELGLKKGSDWVPVADLLSEELRKVAQQRVSILKEHIVTQEDSPSSIRHFSWLLTDWLILLIVLHVSHVPMSDETFE